MSKRLRTTNFSVFFRARPGRVFEFFFVGLLPPVTCQPRPWQNSLFWNPGLAFFEAKKAFDVLEVNINIWHVLTTDSSSLLHGEHEYILALYFRQILKIWNPLSYNKKIVDKKNLRLIWKSLSVIYRYCYSNRDTPQKYSPRTGVSELLTASGRAPKASALRASTGGNQDH